MNKENFSITDFQWSQDLENEFTTYMANCESQIDRSFYDEEGIELEEDFETLSGQPFCGCSTCYVREELFFLIPRILEAYKNGQIVDKTDEE
jgi:hypothetical protein